MSSTLPKQQSYLLRIWPVLVNGQVVWQAYLAHIPGGESQGFASLAQLHEYLERKFFSPAPENVERAADTAKREQEEKANDPEINHLS